VAESLATPVTSAATATIGTTTISKKKSVRRVRKLTAAA
jgi:hypothetical protein